VIIGVAVIAAIAAWTLLVDSSEQPVHAVVAKAEPQVAYPPPLPDTPRDLPPARPSRPGDVELCGFGAVNPDEIPADIEKAADVAIMRAIAGAERSTDDRTRATALALRALTEAQVAERKINDADPQRCTETAECDEAEAEAFARAATPSIQALVNLAVTTRDPFTYVTAMRACRSVIPDAPPPDCSSLSNEQWARLDPNNAMAWLMVARAARQRKDSVTFQDALQRASRADLFDRRATRYGGILESTDLRDAPVRTLAVAKLAEAEEREDPGEYFSNFAMFHLHCAKDEPDRADVCKNLAGVLLDHSADRLGIDLGAAIAPRSKQSSAAIKRLGNTAVTPPKQLASKLSCEGAARTEAWLLGVAKSGEVGYLEEREAARVASQPTRVPAK